MEFRSDLKPNLSELYGLSPEGHLKTGGALFGSIRPVLIHDHNIPHPGDDPLVGWKAVLPIRWLRTAHNDRREKGTGELPEPIQVAHAQGMNIRTDGAPTSGAGVASGITEGIGASIGKSPPRPGKLMLPMTAVTASLMIASLMLS